jgi:hypothetical protein
MNYPQIYVVPRHAGSFQHRDRFVHVIGHIPEVRYARVVVVLTRKESAREIRWVCVGKRVILGVPATKTDVEAANTCAMVIDNNDFLVVRPKLDIIYEINALAMRKRKYAPLDPM